MVRERSAVVVTGLGIISPIGRGEREVLASLRSARSGIREWRSPLLKKAFPAGMVEQRFEGEFSKLELPYLDRCSQMAVLAARDAVTDAGLTSLETYGQRAGLYYGTVRGGAQTEESWVREFHVEGSQAARPFALLASMLNAGAAQISIRQRIRGPSYTHSCACASSGAAIGDAFQAIRDGRLDIALAGGAEASLIPSVLAIWSGIRALAPEDAANVSRSCRPFDRNRSGVVLSEGAVFLVLESREHAVARGAKRYCAVSGYGNASDAVHISLPSAEGQTAALRAALTDARLEPTELDYLNAHATATPGGDPVEVAAIRAVFPDTLRVSSTKSIHGHLLGAASAMEFAVTALAVRDSFLPATAHLDEVAPGCELNHVPNEPIFDFPIRHALSFSAGFGGTNVALVVSRD